MAVTAFDRLRMLWGALDWQHGADTPYSSAQTSAGGADASDVAGHIGIRRSVLVFDRNSFAPGDDDVECHFDWLNVTAGAPDDTWTSGDFTTMEGLLIAFWNGWKVDVDPLTKLREIRWYRHGPGVVAPNPAERVYILPTISPGTGGSSMPPQIACSITFRTAVRASWGRTYMPASGFSMSGSTLRPSATRVDARAADVNTLVTGAAAADFRLVVTSFALSAALNVEHVEIDDVMDVVRRRRFKHTVYRKVIP